MHIYLYNTHMKILSKSSMIICQNQPINNLVANLFKQKMCLIAQYYAYICNAINKYITTNL